MKGFWPSIALAIFGITHSAMGWWDTPMSQISTDDLPSNEEFSKSLGENSGTNFGEKVGNSLAGFSKKMESINSAIAPTNVLKKGQIFF